MDIAISMSIKLHTLLSKLAAILSLAMKRLRLSSRQKNTQSHKRMTQSELFLTAIGISSMLVSMWMWWQASLSFHQRISLTQAAVGRVSHVLSVQMLRLTKKTRVSIWHGQKFAVGLEIHIWAMFSQTVLRTRVACAIVSIVCPLSSFQKLRWRRRATVICWIMFKSILIENLL